MMIIVLIQQGQVKNTLENWMGRLKRILHLSKNWYISFMLITSNIILIWLLAYNDRTTKRVIDY